MSGSAALAAAKRRRGEGNTSLQRIPENESRSVSQQQNITPLQVLAQHHKKLDLLYTRQDKINSVLDINDEEEGGESKLVARIDNIERRLEGDIGKPVNNVNDVALQVNDYESQIKELKDIILKVQAHSLEVSLELLLLKKKLQIENSLVNDKIETGVDVTDEVEVPNETEAKDEVEVTDEVEQKN